MTNENKMQTQKIGVGGSFFNQLMSNNSSEPIVGKGATQIRILFGVKEYYYDWEF